MPVLTVKTRPGTDADAVAGVVPAQVMRPGSIEEVADVLRAARAERSTVVPVGAGTKTGWAAPPTSCDIVLDTTGLDRVVEHSAGDLVVVAEAGVRLEALQAHVGLAGQMLALDPAERGATLGGVVSADASGPRRLRYGTPRGVLIGVTVVLADGTTASAGGKVVKNVAGYDLGKLYTGAHGTLGVVVSTTWRLHPLPPARGTVLVPVADAAEAGRLAQLVARSTLTPSACELRSDDEGLRLVVLFESIAESVESQSQAAVAMLGGEALAEGLPAWFGERPGAAGDLMLRLAFEPFALPAVLAALPPAAVCTASACTGVAYVALPADEGVAALPGLRAALTPYDGTAVVLSGGVRQGLDHWGPVGDALDLMRAVKDRFDPDRLLSPGRFVGGL
jgi:glycolate oxidase FAD binding subunit